MPDLKDAAQARLVSLPLEPGERFRHYKRGGEYEIITLALKEDTLEPVVVYKSLSHGTIWVRTYQDWSQLVEHNGQHRPRFQKV